MDWCRLMKVLFSHGNSTVVSVHGESRDTLGFIDLVMVVVVMVLVTSRITCWIMDGLLGQIGGMGSCRRDVMNICRNPRISWSCCDSFRGRMMEPRGSLSVSHWTCWRGDTRMLLLLPLLLLELDLVLRLQLRLRFSLVRTSGTFTLLSARVGNVLVWKRFRSSVQSCVCCCIILAVHLVRNLVDEVGSLVFELVHGRGLGLHSGVVLVRVHFGYAGWLVKLKVVRKESVVRVLLLLSVVAPGVMMSLCQQT